MPKNVDCFSQACDHLSRYKCVKFYLILVLLMTSFLWAKPQRLTVPDIQDRSGQYENVFLKALDQFKANQTLRLDAPGGVQRISQVNNFDNFYEVVTENGDLYRFLKDRSRSGFEQLDNRLLKFQSKDIPIQSFSKDLAHGFHYLEARFRHDNSKNLLTLMQGKWSSDDLNKNELEKLLKGLSQYKEIVNFSLKDIVWTPTGWIVKGLDRSSTEPIRRGQFSDSSVILKELERNGLVTDTLEPLEKLRPFFNGPELADLHEAMNYFPDNSHPQRLFYQDGKFAKNYETRVQNLIEYLESDSSSPRRIQFSGGETFKVTDFLGQGNTHYIFALDDGRAIRVPREAIAKGVEANETMAADSRVLAQTSIPHPRMYVDEMNSKFEFAIVDRVDTKPHQTLENFLDGTWRLDKEVERSMTKKLVDFMQSLVEVEMVADAGARNIVWNGYQWVLIDYGWNLSPTAQLRTSRDAKNFASSFYDYLMDHTQAGSKFDLYLDKDDRARLSAIDNAGPRDFYAGEYRRLQLFDNGTTGPNYNERMSIVIGDFQSGNTYPVQLEFSDGQKIAVNNILGAGTSTVVFETVDGDAIRVPRTTAHYTDRIKQFIKIHDELATNVTRPKILRASPRSEFVIVEKIDLPENAINARQLLTSTELAKSAEGKRMFQELLKFGRVLDQYSTIPGVGAEHIIWDGNKWQITQMGFFQGSNLEPRVAGKAGAFVEQVFERVDVENGVVAEWKRELASLKEVGRSVTDIRAALGCSLRSLTN